MPTELKRPDLQNDLDSGDTIDILALLRTLWRGKWLILAPALLAGLLASYYVFAVAVPTYRATTQMALQLDQSPFVDIESVVSGVSSDTSSLNTEMEIIRSRELVSRLVDELNLVEDPEFNEALRPANPYSLGAIRAWILTVTGLAPPPIGQSLDPAVAIRNNVIENAREAISTSIERQSFIFSISATTQSPIKSALITNTLARIYQDDQIAIKVEGTENASIWLSERVSELETELQARQSQIADLQSQNALVSPEALTALNQQSVLLDGQLNTARVALGRAESALATLEEADGQDVATRARAADDPQLQSLAAIASAGDPASVLRFDRRYEQLLLQRRALVERASEVVIELQEQLDNLAEQFDSQSASMITIRQLERESEATRVLYETFLTRLRETSVQIGIQQADSRVLSEAVRGEYVAPRKSAIIAIGLILGGIFGAAIVLLREAMQSTYRTAEDMERETGTAVLGQIPRIPERDRVATIRYLASKPTSAAAEAVRNLRTSILMSNVDKPPQVIMSTSSLPGEGKTTIAIALAQNLSGLDNARVLLIEGDIRRRTFAAYFAAAKDKPGILSVISRKVEIRDAVYAHPDLGIDILMGEETSINAADVFASRSFRDMLTELRSRYDYIIIDTPPVLVVPDARVIGPHVDAIMYIVKWDDTSKQQVDEGVRLLRTVNLDITGLTLSQIDMRAMKRYGYGNKYGYGSYSRYSKGYYQN